MKKKVERKEKNLEHFMRYYFWQLFLKHLSKKYINKSVEKFFHVCRNDAFLSLLCYSFCSLSAVVLHRAIT